jgi:exonuclease III
MNPDKPDLPRPSNSMESVKQDNLYKNCSYGDLPIISIYSPRNIEGKIKFPTKLTYCNRLESTKQQTSEDTDEVKIEGSPPNDSTSEQDNAQAITKKTRTKNSSYQHQRPKSLMDDLLDSNEGFIPRNLASPLATMNFTKKIDKEVQTLVLKLVEI